MKLYIHQKLADRDDAREINVCSAMYEVFQGHSIVAACGDEVRVVSDRHVYKLVATLLVLHSEKTLKSAVDEKALIVRAVINGIAVGVSHGAYDQNAWWLQGLIDNVRVAAGYGSSFSEIGAALRDHPYRAIAHLGKDLPEGELLRMLEEVTFS